MDYGANYYTAIEHAHYDILIRMKTNDNEYEK
jgi:hypothetical protein